MRQPLVSVVIPSFNRAYCIGETIDSVLAQTHGNLEILVVDDGSTDGTRQLLAERYRKEPRLRYLHQANAGVSAARNFGLAEAQGEYLALLDSDDHWLPWKLQAQLAVLRAVPEAGMVWTDMDAIDPSGAVVATRYLTTMYDAYRWFSRDELFEKIRPFSTVHPELAKTVGETNVYSGDIYSQMILGNLVHTSTVLLTRERFEKVRRFDVTLKHSGEDYDFHLRTCREGPVAYLDHVSIRYQRGRTDQLTFAPKYAVHMANNFLRTVEPAIARDRPRIRLPQAMLDEVLAEAHAWVGESHFDRGELAEARPHLLASLRRKPRQVRMLRLYAASFAPRSAIERLRRGFSALSTRGR